jgi:hypothetical protein
VLVTFIVDFSRHSPRTTRPLLSHASEEVHDALRTSRATFIPPILIRILELPALLQHAPTLLFIPAHTLGVRVPLLVVLELTIISLVTMRSRLR